MHDGVIDSGAAGALRIRRPRSAISADVFLVPNPSSAAYPKTPGQGGGGVWSIQVRCGFSFSPARKRTLLKSVVGPPVD